MIALVVDEADHSVLGPVLGVGEMNDMLTTETSGFHEAGALPGTRS